MKLWLHARASNLTIAAALILVPAAANAQASSRSDATTLGEVVVTGSFIAGTPEDAALPVDVIGTADLKKQGQPTTVELVKTISSAQSSIGESNRFLGTAAGSATINLRGFGSARTLVLFNGYRMANSPTAIASEATDINFIPQAAIGRIEVLRDGAAATYGSDAVGGVVNFITRRDLDGFEFNGNYTAIDGSNGDYDISGAWGKRFDRGNVLLTATYRRRSELRTVDRDWAVRPFAENFFGGWSTASNPGTYFTGTAAQLASGTFNQPFLDNGCVELGGVLAAGPSCRFHYTLHDNLVNDEYHYQVYGELNFDLTDDITFHGEVLWASHDVPRERVSAAQSTTQFPTPILASGGSPGGGTSPYPATGLNQQSRYYVPATNPGLIAFLAANCPALSPTICANAAANGVITSQTTWRPQGYGGSPLTGDADEQRRYARGLRILGEFKGHVFNDVGWTFALNYGENYGLTETPDLVVNRLQLALSGLGGPNCNPATGTPGVGDCKYYNPFSNAYPNNPVTGETNPFFNGAVANDVDLYRWMHQSLKGETTTQLVTADLVFNGQAPIDLGAGPVGWAVGAQWRYDRAEFNRNPEADINTTPCVDSPPFGDGLPVCSGGTGPYTFYAATEEYDIDRVVRSVFAEVKIPVTDTFELSGAIRYEYYGGVFGSTTNPKVSARWQVADWLALRGSAGSTFRAPPQTSLTPGSTRTLAQFNLPGVGALYRPVDTVNNPDLKAETADTYNLGVILEAGGFRATVDYFKFKFKDELTNETAASVVSTLFPSADAATWRCNVPELRSRFTFADDGNPLTDDCRPANLLGVRTNLINGPNVDTSGVDFQATYFWPDAVFGGDLTFGADGTYTIEYKRGALVTLDGFEIAPAMDRAGKSELLSAFYSYPKWRVNGYVNYHWGDHNIRWTAHFKSGTTNIISSFPDLKTKDEFIHDLVYTGEFPWDTTVTLAIQNIFDKDPPFVRSQYNYDYTNAFFLGRTFKIGVTKRF
jgi:iron complex outermembrane receptor protein